MRRVLALSGVVLCLLAASPPLRAVALSGGPGAAGTAEHCDPCALPGGGTYRVLAPPGWDGHARLPVLMFLHGYTSEGSDIVADQDVAGPAGRLGFLLVAPDGLNRTWAHQGSPSQARDDRIHLAEIFADLDIAAITPPNFSFFLDVPRPHSLYNRKRMLRVADEFLRHGIPVAPHLNATNEADWDFWISLFRDSPELSVYCKEFQTGNHLKQHYERSVAQDAACSGSGWPAIPSFISSWQEAVAWPSPDAHLLHDNRLRSVNEDKPPPNS